MNKVSVVVDDKKVKKKKGNFIQNDYLIKIYTQAPSLRRHQQRKRNWRHWGAAQYIGKTLSMSALFILIYVVGQQAIAWTNQS